MNIFKRWSWHFAGVMFVLILSYWYGTVGWNYYNHQTIAQNIRIAAGAQPPARISALIIDLDGDGVEHYGLSSTEAFFDLDADGFAEKTGWVSADDALLGIDSNGNGRIDDINDLFGDETSNGFEQLALLDSNRDGVIDNLDAAFSSLLLWQDADQDGICDKGELSKLADHRIASINLKRIAINNMEDGNYISDASSIAYVDTTTAVIEDVGFENDQLNTQYIGAYNVSLAPFNKTTLRGYGETVDLRVAMTYDSILKEQVGQLIWSDYRGQDYKLDVRDIFLRWTRSDKVNPGSRGKNVDAKELNALEKYLAFTAGTKLTKRQGQALSTVFNNFVEYLALKFLIQGPIKDIFANITYNGEQDRLEGSTDFTSAIHSFAAFAPADADEAKYFWLNTIKMVDHLSIDMGIPITQHDAVSSKLLTSSSIDLNMTELRSFSIIVGSRRDDTLFSYQGNSAYMFGGAGNDYIVGSDRTDKVFGGKGDDIIEVQAGDDIVDGGAGFDIVLFKGVRADYDIVDVRGKTVVEELVGSEDMKRLVNIENIVFLGAAGKADDETVDLVIKTAPIAGSASLTGNVNTPILIPISELLNNSSDPDGDALTLTFVGKAKNGLVGLYARNQVAFFPDANFSGKASFEYTVMDTTGLTATGTATIQILEK